MGSLFRERPSGDDGYALVSVIGLGTAILLSVGAVSAYSLQAMDSAGSTQGFHASIQAAQAGVDQFVAKLNTATSAADVTAAIAAGTTWQPIPGSQDGVGTACTAVAGGSLPLNCPKFKYAAVPTATGYDIVSTGYSRGDTRSVKVTLQQRSVTDYLYYSAIEAADPLDGFVYPNILGTGGAPAGCEYPSWGANPTQVRPPSGCRVPVWRGLDATDGSRVHTSDVFGASGSPAFDSRVSVASPACAANVANCVVGGNPTYGQGNPSYADDLTMPTAPLDQIALAALAATGCTYTGPTRIEFLKGADSGKMRVWSPQTSYANPADTTRCLGTPPPANLLNATASVNVTVTDANRPLLANILGINLTGLTCSLLGLLCTGSTTSVSLSAILGASANLPLLNDLTAMLPYNPTPVAIPAAIHVKDATASGATTLLQNTQCLLASAAGLGLHSGDLQLALNGLLSSAGAQRCRAGDLYLSGELSGKTTIGTTGSVTIVDDLTYKSRTTDMLGIVALGPVEVYNSLQCVVGLGTCMSLSSLSSLLPSVRNLLLNPTPTKADLTNVLNSLGANESVAVEASILTYRRFGVQLPVLSPSLNVGLINQLVNLNVSPPNLNVFGSVAQRYRGLTSADLLTVTTTASGTASGAISGGPLTVTGQAVATVDLLSANADIGFALKMQYDKRLLTQKPSHLPVSTAAHWVQASFAEVKAVP
ncbi:MAG: hypothetical protein ACT4QG_07755 [Sporichthyaceae bacterium]